MRHVCWQRAQRYGAVAGWDFRGLSCTSSSGSARRHGGLHLTLPLLAWVGLPKAVVRVPVPGDASSLQKSKSSNVQDPLGSLSGFG